MPCVASALEFGRLMNTLTITQYERPHRQGVLDLLFHSPFVHLHLDWLRVEQWLEVPENIVRLAWQHERLIGLVGIAAPLNQTSWLRLAAVVDDAPPNTILTPLWEAICAELNRQQIQLLAALEIENWLGTHLKALGFKYEEDIITLSRSGHTAPEDPQNLVPIRPASVDDLERMAAIDRAAFAPPWQLSFDDLRYAKKLATICTVASINETIVGYQLSTTYQQNGHLARLAVLPEVQGNGVGSSLVHDMILRFQRRNIQTITVNTQASNERSRQLYAHFAFSPNGYDLPVWFFIL
jgi:GNAT superfamily N-acetyltransferase